MLHPQDWQTWPPEDRDWLRAEFQPLPPLSVEQSLANLAQIVGRIRAAADTPVLIFNLCAAVPGELVHSYEGLEAPLSERIRRLNLGLVDLSRQTGAAIVDVDRIIARCGADRLMLDVVHLSAEACRLVAEEVVRVLDDLGVLEPAT